MARITFLGCNIKIWMFFVIIITSLFGGLQVVISVLHYNKTEEIFDKVLYITVPSVLLGAAVLAFLATCFEIKFLLLPLLILVGFILPTVVVNIVNYFIGCMKSPECKGDTKSIVLTSAVFVCSLLVCVCTMLIVCRFYNRLGTATQASTKSEGQAREPQQFLPAQI